jgi:hypothetical protein
MVRFSNIVLAYFVIGVVMFGGGAVQWDNSGVAQFFVEQDQQTGEFQGSENLDSKKDQAGSALGSVANAVAGPILVVWNLAVGLFAALHWPVVVLNSNNAPPIMVLGLGGPFVAAFYLSFIRLIRRSA